MKPRNQRAFKKAKKSIRLGSTIIHLFTSLESNGMDSHSETFSAAIAAMKTKQSCNFIEEIEVCFPTSF